MLRHHDPVEVGNPAFLSLSVQEVTLSCIPDGLLHAFLINTHLRYQPFKGLSALRCFNGYLRNRLSRHLLIEEVYNLIEIIIKKISLNYFSRHLLARTRSSSGYNIFLFIYN